MYLPHGGWPDMSVGLIFWHGNVGIHQTATTTAPTPATPSAPAPSPTPTPTPAAATPPPPQPANETEIPARLSNTSARNYVPATTATTSLPAKDNGNIN